MALAYDSLVALHEAALDATANGIAIIGLDRRIVWANPAFHALFGYAPGTLAGRDLEAFSTPDFLAARERARAAIGQGTSWHGEASVRCADGSTISIEATVTPVPGVEPQARQVVVVVQDISERRRTERDLLRVYSAIEAASESIAITDPLGRIGYANEAMHRLTGCTDGELVGASIDALLRCGERPAFDLEALLVAGAAEVNGLDAELPGRDETIPVRVRVRPIPGSDGAPLGLSVTIEDRRAVRTAEQAHAMMEIRLRQAQKLESIGQLAAGIAHEINTPTQFVGDNIRFLREGFDAMLRLGEACHGLLETAGDGLPSRASLEALRAVEEEADVDFVRAEVPKAIDQSLDGISRIAEIVRAMKEFSHPGQGGASDVDLNRAVRNTVTVARNEWKYDSDVSLDLDADLPPVRCHAGEINQVLLNVVVNAAQAIHEVVSRDPVRRGRIEISTRRTGHCAEVRIKDSGAGIPQAIRSRVFDPFFTTKAVGQGSGQGLAIAYDVIVHKHHGELSFETAEGQGTTFVIRLPLTPPSD